MLCLVVSFKFFESELIPVKVKVSECIAAVKPTQNQNLTVAEKNADELDGINHR